MNKLTNNDDIEDGILTEDQSTWVLVHQSRCSKLPPEKREFRRAVLAFLIRPDARDYFFQEMDALGIADCYGKDAHFCISTGDGFDYREVTE